MSQVLWKDHRSKPAGCFAGNKVLKALRPKLGNIEHEKGTVFSIKRKGKRKKYYIGRVCSNQTYLATSRDEKHFANVSRSQLAAYKSISGDVYYLFITLSGSKIDFWAIPLPLIERILKNLPEKEDGSSFIRIYEEEGRYWIEETDVTKYHQSIRTTPRERKRFCKSA